MFQNREDETFSSVSKRVVDSLSLGNERIVKLVLYETLQVQKRGKKKETRKRRQKTKEERKRNKRGEGLIL